MEALRLPRKPSLLGIIGVMALLALAGLVLAGDLTAHGGVESSIHGCINDNSGGVKIVDASEECKIHETPVDWYFGTTFFATLDKDGNIGEQSGGVTSVHNVEGVTRLSFPTLATNCAVTATLGNPIPDSVSLSDVSGEIEEGTIGIAIHTPSGDISVVTRNKLGNDEDMSFFLLVGCP